MQTFQFAMRNGEDTQPGELEGRVGQLDEFVAIQLRASGNLNYEGDSVRDLEIGQVGENRD